MSNHSSPAEATAHLSPVVALQVVDGELCFHQSQQDRLAGLFRARAAMHARVYQHRSAKAAELMLVDALLAADPVLGISRDADE